MKLNFYLFLAGMSLSACAFAQDYTVQTSQETYQDLQNPISLTNGILWDDENFGIELPFSFSIGNMVLDSVFISDDGEISSESNNFLNYDDEALPIGPLATIMGIGSDMVDRAEHDGGTPVSHISYEFLTENGNQVLVVEYKNIGFFDELVTTTSTDYMNMQIRLIEGGTIEIHYGSSHISYPSEYFGNEMGNLVAIFPNYEITETDLIVLNSDLHVLEGSPDIPTLELITDLNAPTSNGQGFTSFPTDGTKYTFTTSNVGQEEFNTADISVTNPVKRVLEYTSSKVLTQIEFINIQGQIVRVDNTLDHIELSDLNTGTYFAKFYQGNELVSIQKIIKK